MLRHDEWYTVVVHTKAGGRRFDDGIYIARDTTMDQHMAILRSEDALFVSDDWTTTMKEIKCRRAQETTKASRDD